MEIERAVLGRGRSVRCSPDQRSGCAPPPTLGLRSSEIEPAVLGRATLGLRSSVEVVEAPRVEGPGGGIGGEWRVIVLNDDHNTFDGVASTLARVIPGVSLDQGYAMADRIHNSGQAIVWSGEKEPAELYWEQLNDAGLTMAPLERG